MNAIHLKRLSQVAVALEDASRYQFFVKIFTMKKWGYESDPVNCGTPACAIGHFAVRTDLQKSFELRGDTLFYKGRDVGTPAEFRRYFGLSYGEAKLLFSVSGCDKAQTPRQAAKFIRKFIAKKRKS